MNKDTKKAREGVLLFGMSLIAAAVITTVLANMSDDVEEWDTDAAKKLAKMTKSK